MQFDELVEMYLEEFHPSVKRLGYKVHGSDRFINTGAKPDGFKGDTGQPETQNVGDLFPKRNKKYLTSNRKKG